MKKRILMFCLCFMLMGVLPLISARSGIAVSRQQEDQNSEVSQTEKSQSSQADSAQPQKKESKGIFKILDTGSGKVVTVEEKEFCIGAVAYEMPPSFEEEALKAQCIATYTYFCRQREIQLENPESELKGADFSANLSENQFYLSDEALKERWGNLYDESKKKIENAVNAVFGKVLRDKDGNLVNAVYHACSGGATENAEDVFGGYDSCLRAVSSPFDKYAPNYKTSVTVSEEEFKEKISALSSKAEFSEKPESYIQSKEISQSGTVKSIIIGGESFTGSDIRTAFGLRSADFEIKYSDKKFTFTVYGYGHGVGLSQYGAHYMSQQGADYNEILKHYYTDIQISES